MSVLEAFKLERRGLGAGRWRIASWHRHRQRLLSDSGWSGSRRDASGQATSAGRLHPQATSAIEPAFADYRDVQKSVGRLNLAAAIKKNHLNIKISRYPLQLVIE